MRLPVLAISITVDLEKAAGNFTNSWKPQELRSLCCKKMAGTVERREEFCFKSVSVIACPCVDGRDN